MRRIVLSALLLSPVVLHAQANLSPLPHSILRASAFGPRGAESLLAGAVAARDDDHTITTPVAPHSIQTVIISNAEAAKAMADRDADMTGENIFTFEGPPAEFAAPKLLRWTPIQCAQSELDAVGAAEKKLTISMVISQSGSPEEIKVLHSVDPALDRKAVAALREYRFAPATMDHRPTAAPVTVSINFPAR